ncbi:MAG: hypothetical protein ABI743_09370, partial [bacterium]
YELAIAGDGSTASLTSATLRKSQANDDVYDLSVAAYFSNSDLRLASVEHQGGQLQLIFAVAHPFAAPVDPTGAPSSSNRADLGIALSLVFLLDADAGVDTYFAPPETIIANTGLVTNADGLMKPAGLIVAPPSLTATVFPYRNAIDEVADNRVGISNGGSLHGNFDPINGWTRSALGPDHDGWTGYGILHQGQRALVTLTLDEAVLAAEGPVTIPVVPIAKYNDPRGGNTSAQKRGNRLPPEPADTQRFAYRMPHGAADVSTVAFAGESGGLAANLISATTIRAQVTDWDARAIETTAPDLRDEVAPDLVAIGESGLPVLEAVIPSLGITETALTITDDDTVIGGDLTPESGEPNDPLFASASLTNLVQTGQTPGTYWGMIRARDVEDLSAINTSWRFPLDPDLAPLASNLPRPVTYQAFPVTVINGNQPPVPLGLTTPPFVFDGTTTSLTLSGLSDPEFDPITVEADWDNDGSWTLVDTLTWSGSSYGTPITWTSPISYNYTLPAPDVRGLPVRFSDGTNMVVWAPELSFEVLLCVEDSFTSTAAWAGAGFWNPYYTIAASATVPQADVATLRLPGNTGGVIYCAYTSGKYDFYRSFLTVPSPGDNIPITNFTGPNPKAAAQVEVDSTNRVLFTLRTTSDGYFGPPSQLYPAGTGVEQGVYFFDYNVSTPATSHTMIPTGSARIVALALDEEDNVYYIDTNHLLHKLRKNDTPQYKEVTTGGFPLDLQQPSYGGGITLSGATPDRVQRIHDFVIDWRSGAYFVLAESQEANQVSPFVGNGYVYRVECDGSFDPVVAGNANPRRLMLTDVSNHSRKADITIDQLDANGAALATAGSSQIVVSGYVFTIAGTPDLTILDSNLAIVGSRDTDPWSATPLALNTTNVISAGFTLTFMGNYIPYNNTIAYRINPFPGWQ